MTNRRLLGLTHQLTSPHHPWHQFTRKRWKGTTAWSRATSHPLHGVWTQLCRQGSLNCEAGIFPLRSHRASMLKQQWNSNAVGKGFGLFYALHWLLLKYHTECRMLDATILVGCYLSLACVVQANETKVEISSSLNLTECLIIVFHYSALGH